MSNSTEPMRRWKLFALVLGSMLLASACGGAASPIPATSSPTGAATPGPSASSDTSAPSASQEFQPLPPAEQTVIRFGNSSTDPSSYHVIYTIEKGLFKKYGLDVSGLLIDGNGPTLQAILAGQMEVVSTNSGGTILSLTTSSPLVQTGVDTNKLPDFVYGGKGVTGPDQLRGKRVGISQLGGQAHAEVVIMLQGMGLTAADIQLVQIGNEAARIAALQAGTIVAAPAGPEIADKLTAEGFTILAKLPEATTPFAGSGFTWRREYVKQNPNTVLRFMAAVLESQQLQITDSNDVAKYYAAEMQISVADSQAQWQEIVKSGLLQRDLRSNVAAFESVRDILVTINPEVADIDLAPAYDGSFLDKLEAMGYFTAFGVPSQ